MTTAYQADLLSPDTEYNGWTNYETWNAALWIGNDEGLYDIARRAMDWDHLLEIFTCYGSETTGDGVRWDDPKINAVEMDEMLEELWSSSSVSGHHTSILVRSVSPSTR